MKGFTVVELLITVAIISIISTIAIIQYQNYLVRTQVIRVVHEASTMKIPIDICLYESLIQNCNLPLLKSNLMDGSYYNGTKPPIGTGSVSIDMPLTPTTRIVAHFGNSSSSVLKGKSVVWSRSSDGGWMCNTDVDIEYRANNCSIN